MKPRGVSASGAAGVPAVQSASLRLPWASKDRRWTTAPVRAPLEVAQLVEVVGQVLDHGPGEVGRDAVDQAGLRFEAVIVLGRAVLLYSGIGDSSPMAGNSAEKYLYCPQNSRPQNLVVLRGHVFTPDWLGCLGKFILSPIKSGMATADRPREVGCGTNCQVITISEHTGNVAAAGEWLNLILNFAVYTKSATRHDYYHVPRIPGAPSL